MDSGTLFAQSSEVTVNDGSRRKIHHDAGEKVGGAKKDRWKTRDYLSIDDLEELEKSSKDAYFSVNKYSILEKVDIEEEKAAGFSSGAAFLKKKIIDALPVRPEDTREDRERFVNLLHRMKGDLRVSFSVSDIGNAIAGWVGKGVYSSTVGRKFITVLNNARYGHLNRRATKYEENDDWSWTKQKKSGQKTEKLCFSKRVSKQVVRVGGISIDPPTITENMILEAFGFRGVEFGNWLNDEEAGYHILNAVQALYDLAAVLCISTIMLFWNGRLAIAFGARGSGSASAHYEPVKQVINLTKFRGGGSLAHELGHFLDHMLGDVSMSRGKVVYASSDRSYGNPLSGMMRAIKDRGQDRNAYYSLLSEYRKLRSIYDAQKRNKDNRPGDLYDFYLKLRRMYDELERMRKGLNKTGFMGISRFYRDARLLGEYWVRDHELFARAFESYVEDKLAAMGRQNTYLVDGTRVQYRISRKGTTVEPYPQGVERQTISQAFEELFDKLRTKYCQPHPLVAVV